MPTVAPDPSDFFETRLICLDFKTLCVQGKYGGQGLGYDSEDSMLA
jgi:hypothetical protein